MNLTIKNVYILLILVCFGHLMISSNSSSVKLRYRYKDHRGTVTMFTYKDTTWYYYIKNLKYAAFATSNWEACNIVMSSKKPLEIDYIEVCKTIDNNDKTADSKEFSVSYLSPNPIFKEIVESVQLAHRKQSRGPR